MLGQVENVQRDLNQKEVEVKHLTTQLELLTSKNVVQVQELEKEISTLKVRILFVFISNYFLLFNFIFQTELEGNQIHHEMQNRISLTFIFFTWAILEV